MPLELCESCGFCGISKIESIFFFCWKLRDINSIICYFMFFNYTCIKHSATILCPFEIIVSKFYVWLFRWRHSVLKFWYMLIFCSDFFNIRNLINKTKMNWIELNFFIEIWHLNLDIRRFKAAAKDIFM